MIENIAFQAINGLIMGAIYALMALGLNLIWSITDVPEFSQGGIYVIAAYMGYFVTVSGNLPWFLGLIAAMGTGAILGFSFEKLLYRRMRGMILNLLLAAIALFFLLVNVAVWLWTPKAKFLPPYISGEIAFFGLQIGRQRLLVLVLSVILFLFVNLFVWRTKLGKAIRAASQDREAAQLVGINIDTVNSVVFALGGALSGTAAALISPLYAVYPAMGDLPLLKALVVVILGGLGSVQGFLVAGGILGVVESLGAAFISSAYQHGFSFFILILVLLLKPRGLFGRI
ncbi:MAG: branched-chain amino acid ABC transporter permease [Armatimonadota bacterium]|nr:branched-chain amino acid ABC transporter permease [Armatimonadota bacterium]